jgi:1-acyl-sn-glycerol-3-phosphate acyltransferase
MMVAWQGCRWVKSGKQQMVELKKDGPSPRLFSNRKKKGLFARWVDRQFDEDELDRLRSLPTRQNEYGYDPFGFNREEYKTGLLIARFLFKRYFRTRVSGIENVPSGRVLLVANHSGQLPFDAINIHAAMFFNANPPRVVRAMVDRFVPTLPHVGVCFARWGQVLGTSDNCLRLLHDEEAILVFPEGARGIAKPITERYMLKPFGLGFIRLAIETNTPIVPVAVVGAEEQAPAFNVAPLARLINAPAFPIMPFPPFVPILPLPTRYHLLFGEPRQLSGDADDEDEAIAELARQVRLSIESLIRIGRKQRRSIFR